MKFFFLTWACLLCPMSAAELPKLIAHRGASATAPENTLAAFRQAWEEGADGIEGDFYLTADQKVVCLHDKTTKRTAGTELSVTKSTLTELRALDYGAWKDPRFKGEAIPTLEEVLGVLPQGKWFFLEIKDTPRIVKPIADILRAHKADPERVVLISFNADVVSACRQELPGFRSLWLTELKDYPTEGGPANLLSALRATGSTGLAYKATAPVTREWLGEARGKDGILFAWTIDKPDLARHVIDLGVDYIGTNRPAALRKELEQK